MKTDRYTKVVLTLIAVGLFLNAGINLGISLISDAHAAQSVYVTGGELDRVDTVENVTQLWSVINTVDVDTR